MNENYVFSARRSIDPNEWMGIYFENGNLNIRAKASIIPVWIKVMLSKSSGSPGIDTEDMEKFLRDNDRHFDLSSITEKPGSANKYAVASRIMNLARGNLPSSLTSKEAVLNRYGLKDSSGLPVIERIAVIGAKYPCMAICIYPDGELPSSRYPSSAGYQSSNQSQTNIYVCNVM